MTFAMEVAWCADHGLPHSTLLEWDPEDRAKLMAHLMEQSYICQSCGTSRLEWDEDMDAYEAVVTMCRGCLIKDAAQDDAPDIPGARVTLVPRMTAEKLKERPNKRPERRHSG